MSRASLNPDRGRILTVEPATDVNFRPAPTRQAVLRRDSFRQEEAWTLPLV